MSKKDKIRVEFCKYIKTKSFLVLQILPLMLVSYILTTHNIYAISISDKYGPITEKWSELNVGGELRGFQIQNDGTLIYKNTEFSSKLRVEWGSGNGKLESVPPEKIFISSANPSGKLVFIRSNVTNMPFSGLYIADIINRKLIRIDPFYHYGVSDDWLMWSPNEKYALLYEIRDEYPTLHRINLETAETKSIDLNYLAKGVDEIIEYDMSSFIWGDYNTLRWKVDVKCSEIARGLYGIDPKIKEECNPNYLKPSYKIETDIANLDIKLQNITDDNPLRTEVEKRKKDFQNILCAFPPYPEPNFIANIAIRSEAKDLSKEAYYAGLGFYEMGLKSLEIADTFINSGNTEMARSYIEKSARYSKVGGMQINASFSILSNAISIAQWETVATASSAMLSLLFPAKFLHVSIMSVILTGIKFHSEYKIDRTLSNDMKANFKLMEEILIKVVLIKYGVGDEVTKLWGQSKYVYPIFKRLAENTEIKNEVLKAFMAGMGRTLGYTSTQAQKILAEYLTSLTEAQPPSFDRGGCPGDGG